MSQPGMPPSIYSRPAELPRRALRTEDRGLERLFVVLVADRELALPAFVRVRTTAGRTRRT